MDEKKIITIAVLLTCFNRKEKTVASLCNLLRARNYYNSIHPFSIQLHIFLTNDGCTDGTEEAVRELCKDEVLHIVQGNGQCYWAGGMRLAWREALKEKERWQYYLLMNDDTDVLDNVFSDLFKCHDFSLKKYGRPGLYSGITSARNDNTKTTYGGDVYTTRSKTITRRLQPSGEPQEADIITANILLVPSEVVSAIGIFYDGFIHSGADYDYAVMARRHGFRAFVTPSFCGRCDDDHVYDEQECHKLMKMTLAERRRYVLTPTRSDKDYLLLIRRTNPRKYPISLIMRAIRLYLPSLYYKINVARGYYH